jgi:hypothetical protein
MKIPFRGRILKGLLEQLQEPKVSFLFKHLGIHAGRGEKPTNLRFIQNQKEQNSSNRTSNEARLSGAAALLEMNGQRTRENSEESHHASFIT